MKFSKTNLLFSFVLVLILSTSACSGTRSEQAKEVEFTEFQKGDYTHSSFQSKSRGSVDYNVYLPANWSKENASKYPFIILLHGQGEDENTFKAAFPTERLNQWIQEKLIPEVVLLALSGEKDTKDMQWYFENNVMMISSEEEGELRAYCQKMFNTSTASNQVSVIGHSRGASGALNFALRFPTKFASVVSSAFVSDYYIDRLKGTVDENLDEILKSEIKIQMLIGSEDKFVLNNNRVGSPTMSAYFKEKGIPHELKVIEGKPHQLSKLWEYPTNLNYLKFCAGTWK